jgi:hypothetical protein
LDELQALGGEGFRADVIVVDAKKDRKLSMLKQLIVTLVKGLNANLAAIIKKIAVLVCTSIVSNFVDLVYRARFPHVSLLSFNMIFPCAKMHVKMSNSIPK